MRNGGQLRASVRLPTTAIIIALLVPSVVFLAAVALQPIVPVAYLMRDPLQVAEEAAECCSVYYGLVSNLGVPEERRAEDDEPGAGGGPPLLAKD